MGLLIPEEFRMEQLKNDAERVVVEALVDGLSDRWRIVPDVGIREDAADRQVDIVLVNPDWGVMVIEVKGHRLRIKDGLWCGEEGTPLTPQPVDQARDNSYALQRLIQHNVEGLGRINVAFGLAFPNTSDISGEIPLDLARNMLLLKSDLDDVDRAIHQIGDLNRKRGYVGALNEQQIADVVRLLRPDLDFRWDADSSADVTRQRLDDYCDAHISSLISLMENRRVAVRGSAGTGKTRLAIQWARRAWGERDRVLLTCFNEPLADDLRSRIGVVVPSEEPDDATAGDEEEMFLVGAFFELARSFPEIPRIETDGLTGSEWDPIWGALQRHWPKVGARFDTIVIDEAQDFHPAWIGMLEALLDPDGRRRILMVADQDQDLYGRGFVLPRADDGWVQAELTSNFRNAAPIARLLRWRLGGAGSLWFVPEGSGISFRPVDDVAGAIAAVDAELERITEKEGRDWRRVCVATLQTDAREALRKELGLGAWEERNEFIVCENVHRLKGLEFDTVILVAAEPVEDSALLYVGVSRAVSELIVIAPEEVGEFLGLS